MFINKFGNFLSVFLVLYLTEKGYSTFLAGLALGAVGAGSFVGNAVGGSVADRIGRRSTIVVSMFGTALFTLLVPLLSNIYLIIGLSVVIGFFAQLYRPAGGAILVDTVPEQHRVTAFAVLRLAINVGMSVGPLVGGLLSAYSYTYLFLGNAITSFLFGVIVLLLLPETKPQAAEHEERVPDRGYREVFADRALVLYLLSMFAATYVYVQTTSTLPLHVRDVHMSNSFYGLLLGINAITCVFVELPLVRFTERRNPRRVIAFGLVLLSAGVGLTGVADTRKALVLTVVAWTFGEMIYTPVATAYPGMLAPDHLRGRYQGAEGIAITLAQTAGPALGGLFYSISPAGHWLTCGVVALVGAGLILGARHRGSVLAGVAAHTHRERRTPARHRRTSARKDRPVVTDTATEVTMVMRFESES
jgi:MFS family permease